MQHQERRLHVLNVTDRFETVLQQPVDREIGVEMCPDIHGRREGQLQHHPIRLAPRRHLDGDARAQQLTINDDLAVLRRKPASVSYAITESATMLVSVGLPLLPEKPR